MRKLNILDMHRITVDEFRQSSKTPLVVVLDNVRSAYNVGSIFRTADAFRIQSLILCGITPVPPHPEIHKTALGAELAVDWRHTPSALQAVQSLADEGYLTIAVEQAEGSIMLPQFAEEVERLQQQKPSPAGLAIVVGNEVNGVQQDVVDACRTCIEIPQFGTKHSLNVSTAAGIVMWEATNILKKKDDDQT